MRERKTGRLLALLLVAALLLSLLPATVLAVEPGAATTSNDDSLMRIVHLDCGRKYFTVEWVKSLIDKMDEYGYTHLELAFGNDGLRFLLDDMEIEEVTGGNDTWMFGSEVVKDAIKDGNDAYDAKNGYHPGDTEEWTQRDMDEIISYANENGISIIPLLNTPGHMDAILSAANSLGRGNLGTMALRLPSICKKVLSLLSPRPWWRNTWLTFPVRAAPILIWVRTSMPMTFTRPDPWASASLYPRESIICSSTM